MAAELLASRLAEKGLLKRGTEITFYHDKDIDFRKFFSVHEALVYCKDVGSLINKYQVVKYSSEDRRLFIDSSKRCLKAVLLYNGKKLASIPISVVYSENYCTMEFMLDIIDYKNHQWGICTDLKVVTIVLSQLIKFTKISCSICTWDSCDRPNHYNRKIWPLRKNSALRTMDIIEEKLVDASKILLLPLHMKLGLMKQFIKALEVRNSNNLQYLFKILAKLFEAKIKEGVFGGFQI